MVSLQSYFYSVKTIMRRVFLMSFLCVSGFTTIKETKGTNQTDIYHPGKYLVYNHDGVQCVKRRSNAQFLKHVGLLKEA